MATSALETFFLIFSVMSVALTVAVLLFVFKTSKLKNKKELQEERMELIDKHFNEMTRIECPYCKILYNVNRQECPNCQAATKKILFPEMPSQYEKRAFLVLRWLLLFLAHAVGN